MKKNIFEKARIKLTFYYIGIMAIILIAFSSILISTIESKIRTGFQDKMLVTEFEDDPIKNTSDDIEIFIYTIDAILLTLIGFSSYFLAGKTQQPIKEALESQKKFSADASHDLRTPLAIMTTESEVVLRDKNSKLSDLRNTIESNLEETKKMTRLVNDLLLISRGDNQTINRSFSEVDLHNFIHKLVHKITPQIESKNLKINIPQYKKIITHVDKDNFERAISNIFQNAIKYTKNGSIDVDFREENKKITLIISDTGLGISKKDLPYVFDRFYKAEHSRHDQSGSGLGLPITKMIIEEHKGTINIESNVDKGTKVIIIVPKI